MADISALPEGIESNLGWLIRRRKNGHNQSICPKCYATIAHGGPRPCPNGCDVQVCRDFLCTWCEWGKDPGCEGK